jgi:beta-glucosidase
MTSYNTLRGQFCSGNAWILNRWLKEEMHFDGFVISDANAVGGANVLHMTPKSIGNRGLTPERWTGCNLPDLARSRRIVHRWFSQRSDPTEVIDQAVARVLKAKLSSGCSKIPSRSGRSGTTERSS